MLYILGDVICWVSIAVIVLAAVLVVSWEARMIRADRREARKRRDAAARRCTFCSKPADLHTLDEAAACARAVFARGTLPRRHPALSAPVRPPLGGFYADGLADALHQILETAGGER